MSKFVQNGVQNASKMGPFWGSKSVAKKKDSATTHFGPHFGSLLGNFSGPKSFLKSCVLKNQFFHEKSWIFENRALAYVKRPFLKVKADFRAFQCGPKSPKMASKGSKKALFFVIIFLTCSPIFVAIWHLQKRSSHCRKTTLFEKNAC